MISDLKKIKNIRSKKKFTISLAESCTGGMISKYLTIINCSSLFFNGACISYSNQMKIRLLKVPKNTIINYGAVSHQTALAMVKGLKKITDSEILLSVTGVAGPSGGTLRTPVECVFFDQPAFRHNLWIIHPLIVRVLRICLIFSTQVPFGYSPPMFSHHQGR